MLDLAQRLQRSSDLQHCVYVEAALMFFKTQTDAIAPRFSVAGDSGRQFFTSLKKGGG
jgi:hypothetical protein